MNPRQSLGSVGGLAAPRQSPGQRVSFAPQRSTGASPGALSRRARTATHLAIKSRSHTPTAAFRASPGLAHPAAPNADTPPVRRRAAAPARLHLARA